jgi:ribonuclease HII
MLTRSERLKEQAMSLMRYDAAIRRAANIDLLAGVDEVGRGPLAGPLVAAAVVLPDRLLVTGIDDSKNLSPAQRADAAQRIMRVALGWSVAFISPRQIDLAGIQNANMEAMLAAVTRLPLAPQLVLSDGYRIRDFAGRQRAVVKGDALSQSIAAASCLAKAVRDHWMRYLGEECHPGYGWERNAGYATREHKDAVAALGPSPQHRLYFLKTPEHEEQPALPFM